MAYQLSTIVTKVQQRIRDTNYSTAEITNYINDTINDIYNEYRLPFMQTTQAYTVTAGVSDITNGTGLPADYSQALDLLDFTAGQERIILYKDIDYIDDLYADTDDTTIHPAGKPQYWYFYGQTPRLYPVPAGAYTLSLRYYKHPTALSADADVPSIPSQFEELIVVGAAYRTMQVKDDYDTAAVFENKYQELLQKLVVQSSQRQAGAPRQMPINRYKIKKVGYFKGTN